MPAAILVPASEDDVVAGVQLAPGWAGRSHPRGCHSWASWGVRDGALLIELGSMKDMELDPTTNIVSASPAVPVQPNWIRSCQIADGYSQ